MSRAYSADLRERVLDAVADGSSARAAAARFGIGVATAVRWVRRWRDTGSRVAHRRGHPTRSPLDAHEAFLIALAEATPDITLDEMRARLMGDRGVSVARSTIWRFFSRRGWSVKKSPDMPTSRRARMWRPPGRPGSRGSPISTPSG